MATDSELIAAADRNAEVARAAAEGAAAGVAALRAELAAVAAQVAALRVLAPTFVTRIGDPRGTTYVVEALAEEKRWIQDGSRMANLLRRYPIDVEQWEAADLDAIPTIGPEPPPVAPAPA